MKIELFDFINPDTNMEREDGGCSLSASITMDAEGETHDTGVFVKIQSWDPDKHHLDFKQLVNKRIKVTIETLD